MGTLSVDKISKTTTGAQEFVLPATDGTVGQILQTDGSGNLSLNNLSGISVSATTLSATGAFTSLGIDDNASAVAMTIESDGDVLIGTTDTTSSRLHVYDAGFPATTFTRFKTGETSALRDVSRITLKTDGDAADGFGPALQFDITDTGVTDSNLGSIGAVREGGDTLGAIVFKMQGVEKFRCGPTGNVKMTGSGSIGIATATVADDAVTSFTPSSNRGMIFAGGVSTHMGAAGYVCINGGSQEAYLLLNSAGTFAVGTGVPTGTTGTDARFNIFAASDGKIYFENRLGGSFTFWYFTMGLPW